MPQRNSTCEKTKLAPLVLIANAIVASGIAIEPLLAHSEGALASSNVSFETMTEGTIVVEKGAIDVPLNYSINNGSKISLPYYRLSAREETGAAPVFLLAGGPGSPWVERFELQIRAKNEYFVEKDRRAKSHRIIGISGRRAREKNRAKGEFKNTNGPYFSETIISAPETVKLLAKMVIFGPLSPDAAQKRCCFWRYL